MPPDSMPDRFLDPPDEPSGASGATAEHDLAELRELLVGRERAELEALKERIEHFVVSAEDVGAVLPHAVRWRRAQDGELGRALLPTIESAITESVRRQPATLANAIFPILGPAIRKAVAQALSGMIRAINTAIDHSVSAQGLRWRWEAARTGIPFAEVVLRHTIVYRVEQVFLIHRETGLLLQHVSADPAEAENADMISGMLTAIRDFVADSFQEAEGGLQRFTVGALTVLVEQGPSALVAGLVRGHPPRELRQVMSECAERVHLDLGSALAQFEGDPTPFEAARPELESCLRMEQQEAAGSGGLSPALIGMLGLVVLATGVFVFVRWQGGRRWDRVVERIAATPGIVIVDAERSGSTYRLAGLRDPLSDDIGPFMAAAGVDTSRVTTDWEPYFSFDPTLMTRRASTLLGAPSSVSFNFDDGVLTASGSAPAAWVRTARSRAPMLVGVTDFVTDDLRDDEGATMERLRARIEGQRIEFGAGEVIPEPAHASVLDSVAGWIVEVVTLSSASSRRVEVELIGRADRVGTPTTNLAVSRRRAEGVRDALIDRGVPGAVLRSVGVGDRDPLTDQPQDGRSNRSVAIHVRWEDL